MNDELHESAMSSFDMADLQQDVNDPVWPSEPADTAVGTMSTGHHHGGLRTVTGAIDLMHNVVEEVDEWIGRDTQEGPGHIPPRKRDKPMLLEVFNRSTKSWRAVTWNVGNTASGGMKIVESRPDRLRVVVTNWGPGILYLSHDSGSGLTEPQTNTVQVPPPGPDATKTGQQNWREFRTQGEIWAFPAAPGTPQLCDVQDEYGPPE
jgi:hypothetical protein